MSNAAAAKTQSRKKSKKNSQLKEVWRRFRKNKSAMVGLVILVIFALAAIFADLIVPYERAIEQNGSVRLQGPSSEHWFGTDAFGRDTFARIIHGSRVSLSIGFAAVGISLIIGGFLGAAAGYYGGRTDNIIMRIMDVFTCVPGILLALAIVAALGSSMTNLLIAITIANIPGFVRLVRSSILTVVENDFIEAARSYGAKDFRIIVKYILPNAMGPIIVQATMGIAGMILSASGLSYMGMGIQPPRPEWGAMLSEAKDYMRTAPYLLLFPGFAILISALCFNLVGDGLRDALDPKLKD
ncbi:MAG TPA: ABC transporter permease [Candidatus Ventrousia excrementavium]|uniref:ABC transporter permease n=1 Tax=Candidatus Ventrousia excrementavium TaxID=2840961 RepID=A0A9D1S159_9CLOT|nr:ABC transporter permease [Candidatus Ventrousia excrementavium]